MRHYLVTGGLGFIGSHLVDAMVARGDRVRVVDDLSTGTRDHLPAGVELIEADLCKPGVVERAMAGIDGCFHLAAVASVARCNRDWLACHQINVGASIAIFEVAAQQKTPVVYASSAAVYGDNPNVPLDESEPVAPLSPYGVDKAACEMHARVGAAIHGLTSIGLRFFNVYGPRQRPDDAYAGVMTIFRERIARGEPLVIYGDGSQTRDFIHVGEVVRGVTLAMARLEARAGEAVAELFNICTGRETTVLQLAQELAGGRDITIRHASARTGEIARSAGLPAKAGRVLGFDASKALALPGR